MAQTPRQLPDATFIVRFIAAHGELMTGVPATTDVHVRNGAAAISYISTLLLQLVDQGCANCHPLDEAHDYGLGGVLHGPSLLQNPLFAGYGAGEAFLPAEKIAISVNAAYGEDSFTEQGTSVRGNDSQLIFEDIAELLAPGSTPQFWLLHNCRVRIDWPRIACINAREQMVGWRQSRRIR